MVGLTDPDDLTVSPIFIFPSGQAGRWCFDD